MKDKPRRSGKDGDFIITRPMAYNIFGVGLAFVIVLMGLLLHFHAQDGLTPHDLSWFFSFFVMLQFWNMFNAKAFMEGRSAFANLKGSKSFLLVALLIIVGQYLIVRSAARCSVSFRYPGKTEESLSALLRWFSGSGGGWTADRRLENN